MTTARARRVWAPEDKVRIVLESLNTNVTLSELCRKYAVSPAVFYNWREKFVQGGKLALSGALKNPAKEKQAEVERLKKLIGGANDCKRCDEAGPAGRGEKMSVAIMVNHGLSLRKALVASGSSQGSYYYKPTGRVRQDRGKLRGSCRSLCDKRACPEEANLRNEDDGCPSLQGDWKTGEQEARPARFPHHGMEPASDDEEGVNQNEG